MEMVIVLHPAAAVCHVLHFQFPVPLHHSFLAYQWQNLRHASSLTNYTSVLSWNDIPSIDHRYYLQTSKGHMTWII